MHSHILILREFSNPNVTVNKAQGQKYKRQEHTCFHDPYLRVGNCILHFLYDKDFNTFCIYTSN